MISVLVDTNIISLSPSLSRGEWASLSEHSTDWEVSLLVPEIVVMEATEVIPREWAKQQDHLRKAKVREFGLQNELDALVQGIQEHIDGYENQLNARFAELGVEKVPLPEVAHAEIAFRASRRKAPYHEGDKDGYRDALIWFTVLDVADKNPGHEVWFVSDNNQDFGDPAFKKKDAGNGETAQLPRSLHPDLLNDLVSRGLQDRVKYATSLAALEQHIAAVHASITETELRRLISLINWDTVQALLDDHASIVVSPKDTAINPEFVQAVVNERLARDDTWKFTDAAGRSQDRWTANFSVEVDASLVAFTADASSAPYLLSKPLIATGTVAFTKLGEALDLQIVRLEALPDDPDLGVWSVMRAAGFGQPEWHWGRETATSRTFRESVMASAGRLSAQSARTMAEALNFGGLANLSSTAKAVIEAAERAGGMKLAAEAAKTVADAARLAGGTEIPEASRSIAEATKVAGSWKLPDHDAKVIAEAAKFARGASLSAEAIRTINHANDIAKGQNLPSSMSTSVDRARERVEHARDGDASEGKLSPSKEPTPTDG